jgi:protein-tyrosine phosphatase
MAGYQLTWITDHLAAGHAPMSFDDLAAIRGTGIDSIVNLCAEYCDLHDIERQGGFEVYYLPIEDEQAPDLEEMERALAWLDRAIRRGRKVLVHCRFGMGRTGTLLTAYFLRCGFDLKAAGRKVKDIRPSATSFYQWRLLKKYSKKTRQPLD